MDMDKLVSLCKRRGFLFQSSEIYGGLNGFWDYGPLGVELKRNIKEAWWQDMVRGHDELVAPPGAPSAFEMTGLDCTIIMHPQVWKCSGHFDLFCDWMVDCKETKARYRTDHLYCYAVSQKEQDGFEKFGYAASILDPVNFQETLSKSMFRRLEKAFGIKEPVVDTSSKPFSAIAPEERSKVLAPEASHVGTLTQPREFNLMFKTIVGAMGTEEDAAFLRPETAQGIFVNFKNVLDSTRVKVPFGIAQMGKSFRNEITPRNFTFRSREFEQMEIEFFCHPSESRAWYTYWRDRRYKWYLDLGIKSENLILRDHAADELSHYSVGTADVEYAFPFLAEGEYGELEGIAHRGDFDLRSHMEGKLAKQGNELVVEMNAEGKPKHRGSGKDLSYFDDQTRERFIPHVIEPSAGADRGTLAFICEAYDEDTAPDDKGNAQERVVMRFHPRLAPIKAAVFPLIKKEGMPEKAIEIYRALKVAGIETTYDVSGAIGRRYRRQDEIGTPFCFTIDGQTIQDGTVTVRDRDSLEQKRIAADEVVAFVKEKVD
jgi:glycyl-tRNA synthetase